MPLPELVRIIDTLPRDFAATHAEARGEGHRHLTRLADDWASRAMRFERDGEMLLAAYLEGQLAGIGGLTVDAVTIGAFRMRRFYIRPGFRRRGIGRLLAAALIERMLPTARAVTVNAGIAGASAFWEALGFAPDPRAGHTHILHIDRRAG